MSVTCPYCKNPAEFVTGKEVYPHREDLHSKSYWRCTPCAAYVGCHAPNQHRGLTGREPLGRLANDALRKAKRRAHAAFDPLWMGGRMSRSAAYHWLAGKLGLSEDATHIGEFDVELCFKTVEVCKQRAK